NNLSSGVSYPYEQSEGRAFGQTGDARPVLERGHGMADRQGVGRVPATAGVLSPPPVVGGGSFAPRGGPAERKRRRRRTPRRRQRGSILRCDTALMPPDH